MQYNVVAVVVAYNNPDELDECLTSLINQTYKVNRIVCIDNSNITYATLNMDIIQKVDNRSIVVYHKNETNNTGSAKGFELGMRFALGYNPDFIWLNDQDGVADSFSLEKMIQSYQTRIDVGVVVPCVRSKITNEYMRNFSCDFNYFLHTKGVHKAINETKDRIIEKFATTGTLINRNVLDKCGIYNGDIYYIGLEDVDYSLRVKQEGFKVLYSGLSVYHHPDLVKKYSAKTKGISPKIYTILEKIAPLNLGYVLKDDFIEKDQKKNRAIISCIASSYINTLYAPKLSRIYNYFAAFLRLIVLKLQNNKVDVTNTIKLYFEGRKLGISRTRIN